MSIWCIIRHESFTNFRNDGESEEEKKSNKKKALKLYTVLAEEGDIEK